MAECKALMGSAVKGLIGSEKVKLNCFSKL